MPSYSMVRFVGFAIPTGPADVVGIGDVDGNGAVAGRYVALAEREADIRARLAVMEVAVDQTFARLPKTDEGEVLTVFVAPEFYWHSDIGPYVFVEGEDDPAETILSLLSERFPAQKYPDTLFVFGTAITAQVANLEAVFGDSSVAVRNRVVQSISEGWLNSTGAIKDALFDMMVNFVKLGHAYPRVDVRNRALVVGGQALAGVRGGFSAPAATTEKYFASNEDFLLWDIGGKQVVTEQMVAYPNLDLSGGDFKTAAQDSAAIFRFAQGPTVGVEICLDHADQRLRRSTLRSPWPEGKNALALHLVPSCGMQLKPASIAAAAGGLAFNCDGLYALPDEGTPATASCVGGVDSAHLSYRGVSGAGAHSQLTRVTAGPVGADSAGPGARDARCAQPGGDVFAAPMPAVEGLSDVFAGGPGELHFFGAEQPFSLL